MNTKSIALSVLKEPPHLSTRPYKPSEDFYLFKMIKPIIVKELLQQAPNYNHLDYSNMRTNEINNEFTRNIIENDLKYVLMDALLETLYQPINSEILADDYDDSEEDDYCINHKYIVDVPWDETIKKILEINLCKHLNKLVAERVSILLPFNDINMHLC